MPNTESIEQTRRALEIALNHFNWATGPYVDAAIMELSAAEMRLSAAIQEQRSLFCLNTLDKPTNRGRVY